MTACEEKAMHALGQRLWPIHRSLTGAGSRETLGIFQKELSRLTIHEVPSGTQVIDWWVPNQWNIRKARLIGPHSKIVIDYVGSSLHVVGYSMLCDPEQTLDELHPHQHLIPKQSDAIPIMTGAVS